MFRLSRSVTKENLHYSLHLREVTGSVMRFPALLITARLHQGGAEMRSKEEVSAHMRIRGIKLSGAVNVCGYNGLFITIITHIGLLWSLEVTLR